jgi:hypothetical protein
MDCHTVTRLVEKALEALDDGRLAEVREILISIREWLVEGRQ